MLTTHMDGHLTTLPQIKLVQQLELSLKLHPLSMLIPFLRALLRSRCGGMHIVQMHKWVTHKSFRTTYNGTLEQEGWNGQI